MAEKGVSACECHAGFLFLTAYPALGEAQRRNGKGGISPVDTVASGDYRTSDDE